VKNAGEELHCSGFSCTVGTDETNKRTLFQRKRELLDRLNLAIRAMKERAKRSLKPFSAYGRFVRHAEGINGNNGQLIILSKFYREKNIFM
jgi:hypothetical protein